MITAILQAIVAIPQLIKAIQNLIAWLEKVEKEKWFEVKNNAMRAAEKAKTEKEYREAIRKIHEATKKL